MLIVHMLSLAIACFALHAMLAARKPHPAYLTQFYIFLSLGGVLGGMFNTLAAPLIFTNTTEYPLLLALASITLFVNRSIRSRLLTHGWIMWLTIIGAASLTFLLNDINPKWDVALLGASSAFICCLIALIATRTEKTRKFVTVMTIVLPLCGYFIANAVVTQNSSTLLAEKRNFFGTVRVVHDKKMDANKLIYNTTLHGLQWSNPKRKLEPTSYYRDTLSEVLDTFGTSKDPIAIIGLGVGTTQCLAKQNQHIDFYDINQTVIDFAENPDYFTYLRDCPGTHTHILGDGRLMLSKAKPHTYRIIVIDAFSSDAIPVHIVTREALESYIPKLRDGGVILLHITNRYIDLPPLFARQAEAMGWVAYVKDFSTPYFGKLTIDSKWLVLAPSDEAIAPLLAKHKGWEKPAPLQGTRPWTDSYSNILPYFKFLD